MPPRVTKPKAGGRVTDVPPSPASTQADESDNAGPPSKKREWGAPVGEIPQLIGPKKRAKTEAEKEQRKKERIVRNRRAADKSRQKGKEKLASLEAEVEYLKRYKRIADHYIRIYGEPDLDLEDAPPEDEYGGSRSPPVYGEPQSPPISTYDAISNYGESRSPSLGPSTTGPDTPMTEEEVNNAYRWDPEQLDERGQLKNPNDLPPNYFEVDRERRRRAGIVDPPPFEQRHSAVVVGQQRRS